MPRFGRARPRLPGLLACTLLLAPPALAQVAGSAGAPTTAVPADTVHRARPHGLVPVGSWEEDRLRMDQDLGLTPTDGWLLRTPLVAGAPPPAGGKPRVLPFGPQVRFVHETQIPFSANQGMLWAGVGTNFEVTAGLRADLGPLTLVAAPRAVIQPNGDFQVVPYGHDGSRSRYSSPWHWGTESADLPLRYGARRQFGVSAGESSVTLRLGGAAVGGSTETQWWGPGVRDALVMSSNAPAFPHLFLRTAHPLRTPLGTVEGRWIVGRLSESAYFDTIPSNDHRALAGIAATLAPRGAPGLTLGAARVVYGPWTGFFPARAADVFRGVGHPDVAPVADSVMAANPTGRDQILSLFGRWVFPASGLEAYGEWARFDLPTSLRDALVDPGRSAGFTLGLQWVRPLAAESRVRLQAEITSLEQTDRNGIHAVGFYTSRSVLQGYTNRGRVIGAAVGPGGSGQWAAGDYVRGRWHAGLYAWRIRWENDAFYRQPTAALVGHDVSLLAGLRGGARVGGLELEAEAGTHRRLNYLFQSSAHDFGDVDQTIDLVSHTLVLSARWVGI
jgi:hypothetical protein